MPVFDAHCDTVLSIVDKGVDIRQRLDSGHLDLPRMREGGGRCQVFAAFNAHSRDGDGVVQRTRALLRAVHHLAEIPGIAIPSSAAELRRLFETDVDIGIIPAVEGGDALGGDVAEVARLRQLGVAYLTAVSDPSPLKM